MLNVDESSGFINVTERELYPILSMLDIGIMITDTKGVVTYYNPKHAEMDGLDPGDVLGKKLTEVYDQDEESSLVMRCLRTARPILDCPVLYKTINGRVVDSIHNVAPLTRDGLLIGAVSLIKYYQMEEHGDGQRPDKLMQMTFAGDTDFCFDDIVGKSNSLLTAVNKARLAAQTDSPVLIHGETGTGKELFAQSIHNSSKRKKKRYIAVNCSAIPENLLEGILFGTSKGAFTGALDRPGLFERANGGTIFLDEINSMSKEMQPKLLRVMQERRVSRVGSHQETRLDIKIIGSINTSLEETLLSGEIRSDLLFRLSVVYVSLPPLRERKGDVPLLAESFVRKYNKALGKSVSGISDEVANIFQEHSWPGNIRELENTVEGAMNMLLGESLIEKWHLVSGISFLSKCPDCGDFKTTSQAADSMYRGNAESSLPQTLPVSERTISDERKVFLDALKDADGNISDAAIILGISRQTFYRKIKAMKLELPKKSSETTREEIVELLAEKNGNITQVAQALGISRQLLKYRIGKMKIEY